MATKKKAADEEKDAPTGTQQRLDGVIEKTDPELDLLVATYQKAKKKRMRASELEVAAKDNLMKAMDEKKLTIYENDEYTVDITVEKRKLKVKDKTDGDDEDEDETDD